MPPSSAGTGVGRGAVGGVVRAGGDRGFTAAGLAAGLGAGFGASLGCDLQARFRRQRFAINGDEVADLGRVRPFARAMLTWTPAPRD